MLRTFKGGEKARGFCQVNLFILNITNCEFKYFAQVSIVCSFCLILRICWFRQLHLEKFVDFVDIVDDDEKKKYPRIHPWVRLVPTQEYLPQPNLECALQVT